MKRRIISLLMCAVMTFSLLPTAAWAELLPAQDGAESAAPAVYQVSEDTAATEDAAQSGEDEDENAIALFAAHEAEYAGVSYPTLVNAFAAAAENPGGTVKLLKNVTLAKEDGTGIEVTYAVTLDLNGCKIEKENYADADNATYWKYSVFLVQSGGNLTIMDSATGGEIVQPNTKPVVTVTGGTLTVNSGTLKATKTGGGVMQYAVSCAVYVSFSQGEYGPVYLNGGTFSGGTAGVVAMNKTVYITGGEFYGGTSNALYVNSGKAAVLSGGTYKTGVANGNSIYHATGWETNYEATALLASNYQYVSENDQAATISDDQRGVVGTAKVVPKDDAVEYIGENGKKAVRTDAKEVTALTDFEMSSDWYVVDGEVTIPTLTVTSSDVNLILRDNATLTVTGNIQGDEGGTLATLNVYLQAGGTGKLVADNAASQSVTITPKSPSMKMVKIGDETTATDGHSGGFTVSKCDHAGIEYTDKTETGHSGTCALCNTTVSGTHTYDKWTSKDADTHTAECAVCTYPVTAKHSFDLSSNDDGLHHTRQCDTCEYKVEEDHIYNNNNNNTCECGAVLTATCNNVQYAKLDKAIAAAQEVGSATVTLERDVAETITVTSGTVTIDLNQHTWSTAATPLTVSGGTVTLKNGVLRQLSDDLTKKGNGLLITGGSVTVEENTIIDGMARAIDLQGGSLTLGEGATLVGGLKVPTGKTLSSCLTPGTAFVQCTISGTTVTPDSTAYITEAHSVSESTADDDGLVASMTVVHHTHQIINGDPCDCGYECPSEHSAGWDTAMCPTCGMAASAQVTGSTTKYYAEFADAFIAANGKENCTLKLLQDGSINAQGPVYITGPFTLDLNGHTVKELAVGWGWDANYQPLATPIPGELTLTDTSADRSGAVAYNNGLTLYAGTLNISNAYVAKLNCVSGTVTASGNIGSNEQYVTLYWEIGGTLTIGKDTTVGDATFLSKGDGSITVTGGTFGYTRFSNSNNGTTTISGGTFETITTGDNAQLMSLLAKGYAFEDSTGVKDGTATSLTGVTVKEHTHSFDTNGKCACGIETIVSDNKSGIYGTLQAALNAAASDSTIQWVQLNKDVTESVTFDHPGASITLNMNGKTLTCTDGVPLTVTSGTLTVTGTATIIQKRASDNADTFPAIKITGGELVFTGELNATGGPLTNDRNPAVLANGGTLEFKTKVSLLGGLTVTGSAILRGGLKLGSTLTHESQETKTVTLDVSGHNTYQDLRGLLENDNTLAYRNDSAVGTPLLSVTPSRVKDTVANLTVVSHTHEYAPIKNEDGITYSYTSSKCPCGLSCNHGMHGWTNGVCKNCHVACPHPTDELNAAHDTCNYCKAQLAASVTVGETTTYYVGLANALNAAGAEKSGTVKVDLLRNASMWIINPIGVHLFPNSVKINGGATVLLNLNGHTVTGADFDEEEDFVPIDIKAGTLRIDTDDNTNTGALNRTKINVLSGGTLNLSYLGAATIEAVVVDGGALQMTQSFNVKINTLTLTNPASGTKILSGTFGKINAAANLTAVDITSTDPYVFQKIENGDCVKRTDPINGLTNVTVVYCPHKEIDENRLCTICGEEMKVRITAADGSVSYAKYLTTTALSKGVVTLLTDTSTGFLGSNPASGTIDLNGHNLTDTTLVQKTLTLQNSSATTGTVTNLILGEDEIYGEGTLVIDSDNITVTKLEVVKNGSTALTHGTFGEITVSQEGKTAIDLLAAGYAFADASGAVVNANVTSLTNVRVVAHTHNGPNCACGFTCTAHNWEKKDGVCTICNYHCPHESAAANEAGVWSCDTCAQQMVARVEVNTTTAYTADLKAALENTVNGTTVTLLADASMNYAEICGTDSSVKTVTLDLNGHNVTSKFSIKVGKLNYATFENNTVNPGKLIVKGEGNIQCNDGYGIAVNVQSALDLSGWTGGTISRVDVCDNSSFGGTGREPSLTIGEKAGTITELQYLHWALDNVTETKLSGGKYGTISRTGDARGTIVLGKLLKEGYAFKKADGTFLAYNTALETDSSIENLSVVLCPHTSVTSVTSETGVMSGTCDYCNTANIAAVLDGATFDNVETAINQWLSSGGTLTLHANAENITGAKDWSGDSTKTYVLDLNGHTLLDTNRNDSGVDQSYTITATNMKLTIRDTSKAANGQLDNLLLGGGASLTLESGWLGHLNVTKKAGDVSLQGGGLKDRFDTAIPTAYLLPDGYDLKEAATLSFHGTGELKTYTVQKIPATISDKKDDRTMPYGRNRLSFQPEVTLEAGAEEPNQIAFAWYLWDGKDARNLADTYLFKNGTDWTYKETAASSNAYDGLTVGNTYKVFAVVKATGKSTNDVLWRAALTGYSLTVTKGDLSVAKITPTGEGNTSAKDGRLVVYPFGGQVSFLSDVTYDFKVTCYRNKNKLELGKDYEVVERSDTAQHAGKYTLTIRGIGNYAGEATQTWEIEPYKLGSICSSNIWKYYDGTATLERNHIPENIAFFDEDSSGVNPYIGSSISLKNGEDPGLQVSNMSFDSAEVGERVATFTITLTNDDFVLSNGAKQMTVQMGRPLNPNSTNYTEIMKRPAGTPQSGTLSVMNDHAGTYTAELAGLLPTLDSPMVYGDVTYKVKSVDLGSYYTSGAAVDANGKLTLPIQAVTTDEEKTIGTVTVTVSSTNVRDFDVTVTVNATNKLVPTGAPTLDKTTITYGETVGSIALTGSMTADGKTVAGTFTWDAPNAMPNARSAYQAAWTFTPTDTQHYLEAHGTASITIDRAALKDVSVKQVGTLTYNGSEQAAQVETKATTVDETSVRFRYGTHPYGSFAAEMPKFTNAGTYTVYYEAVDPSLNHKPVGGSFTVTVAPKSIEGAAVSAANTVYTGKVQMPVVTSVTVDGLTLTAADYTLKSSGAVSVGDYTFTVTGKGNFTGTAQGKFTVTKAAALTVSPIRLDVTNNYASEYTADLRAALEKALPENSRLGAVTYDAPRFADDKGYCDAAQAAISTNGVLTLPVKAVNTAAEGEVARVTVAVTCGNFENTTVTVVLYAANKPVPTGTPTPSRTTLTYGEALNSITLSGKMTSGGENVPGTFAWKEPNLRPAAGELTAAWVFTPDDGKYAAVTGTIRLTVSEPVVPTYTVGGTVKTYSLTDSTAPQQPAADAIVTIRKGVEILGGQKRTDAEGQFSLDGVPAGVYNVVVEYQGKTVTQKVEITDHNVAGLNVEIPLEDVNSKLDIKDSGGLTEDLVVGGLEKEANDQFNKDGTAASGGSVDVKMEIESKPENKNDAEQSAIREAAKEKALDFIDMALSLVRNGEEKPLPETRNVLEIIISYDTSRAGITVIRHHDGNVENFKRLDSLTPGQDMTFYVDEANKCIHIFTSRFSTYAIGYEPAGSSGGSSGGGTWPSITAEKTSPDAHSATDYTGGIYGLTFRSSASFASFRGVQVDGKTIDPSNYIAEEGSIVVYLKAVYLRTLKPGKHTVTILSSDGDATTSFTIGGNSSPATGDAGLLPYAALALTGCTGVALTLRRKRRED